jgi:hypothetical protein
MAITAINAVVARMVLVAELNGLLALDESSRIPRRAIDFGQHPERSQQDKDGSENAQLSQHICAVMKDLRHRARPFLMNLSSFASGRRKTGNAGMRKPT